MIDPLPNGTAHSFVEMLRDMYSALLVGAAMAVAALVLVLAGRRPRARSGEFDGDALGFVGSVLNGMFIAIVAFYIVIAWQNYDVADQQASAEAAELVDLYWHTDALPSQQREEVRSLIRGYTAEVIGKEWPAMATGDSSPTTDTLLASLHRAAKPADAALAQSVDRNLRMITDSRRARLEQAAARDSWLELLLYGSLAAGALMVVYPVLMGLSTGSRHITALVLLTGILGVVAYVEIGLLHPFSGVISVGPDAFRAAQGEFARI